MFFNIFIQKAHLKTVFGTYIFFINIFKISLLLYTALATQHEDVSTFVYTKPPIFPLSFPFSVSLDPEPPESGTGGGVEDVVGAVEDFLRREGEALEVWGVALPSLVSAALALKDVKPPHGLTYSLQQQGEPRPHPHGCHPLLLPDVFNQQ